MLNQVSENPISFDLPADNASQIQKHSEIQFNSSASNKIGVSLTLDKEMIRKITGYMDRHPVGFDEFIVSAIEFYLAQDQSEKLALEAIQQSITSNLRHALGRSQKT